MRYRKCLIRWLSEKENGITGLETAIILIAFVVVAAVFAYTTLTAGLFTTQKSQETVYGALREAESTIQLDGALIAMDEDNNDKVDKMQFSVKLALGSEPIDFTPNSGATAGSNKIVIDYVDSSQQVSNLDWSLSKLGSADSDNLLETNEIFGITIPDLESGTNNGLNPDLQRKTTFSLIVKSPKGAHLSIERTTPREIDPVMNLN